MTDYKLSRLPLFIGLLLVSGVMASCGGGSPKNNGMATGLGVQLVFPEGFVVDRSSGRVYAPSGPLAEAAPSYVTRVTLSVTGNDIEPIIHDVSLATGVVEGSVPPGDYLFFVVVETDIGASFSGQTLATLVSGDNTGVVIELEVNAPPTSEFGIVVSNPNPKKNEQITFSVVVTDPDPNDILTYNWSGDGWAVTGTGNTVVWSAASGGSYTISVIVDDGHGGSFRASVTVTVQNRPPVINSVTVSDSSPKVGVAVTLSCSASDPDGDSLTYSWSGSNGFAASGASVSYTPSSIGSVTMTCTVSDGDSGGTISASVTLGATSPLVTIGDLAAVASAPDTIVLTWTMDPDTTYTLHWSTAGFVLRPGRSSQVGVGSGVEPNVGSPYTHSGLTSNTTYYYYLEGTKNRVTEIVSAEVSATTPAFGGREMSP